MSPFSQQTDFDLCHNIPATVTNTLNNCSVSWSTYWKNINANRSLPDGFGKYGYQPDQYQRCSGSASGDRQIFRRALQSSVSDDPGTLRGNEQQFMVTNRQRYREKVSQMVSWGHWFALFNILLAMVLGCRYLFVADWPTTLTGRVYSWMSLVGHFSFLVFATYLLILFPLTFIVMSQRLMRFLSAILATAGMTLLLIDSEVFTRFHLHLNPVVWELVINPDQNETARDWQLMFISVPIILLIEMLFATWSWQNSAV